ncbi:hypothetical protein GEMRC1_010353 [Eukaryota sp. GEM-RC1]
MFALSQTESKHLSQFLLDARSVSRHQSEQDPNSTIFSDPRGFASVLTLIYSDTSVPHLLEDDLVEDTFKDDHPHFHSSQDIFDDIPLLRDDPIALSPCPSEVLSESDSPSLLDSLFPISSPSQVTQTSLPSVANLSLFRSLFYFVFGYYRFIHSFPKLRLSNISSFLHLEYSRNCLYLQQLTRRLLLGSCCLKIDFAVVETVTEVFCDDVPQKVRSSEKLFNYAEPEFKKRRLRLLSVLNQRSTSVANVDTKSSKTTGFLTARGSTVANVDTKPPETTGFLTARGSTVVNVDTKPPETTGFLTARGSTVANVDTKPPETTGFLTARGSTVANVDTKPPETTGFLTARGSTVANFDTKPPETTGFLTARGSTVANVDTKPPETTGFLTARGSTVANFDTKPPENTGFLTARGSTVANFDTKPPETTGFLTARGSTVANVDTKPPETTGFLTARGSTVANFDTKPPETTGFLTARGSTVANVDTKPPETTRFLTARGSTVANVDTKPPETTGFLTARGSTVANVDTKPPETTGFLTARESTVTNVDTKPPETTGFLTARGSTVANVDTKPPETTGFLTARGSTVANVDTKPPETTGFLTARGSTVTNVDTKPPETTGFLTARGSTVANVDTKPPETTGFLTARGSTVANVDTKPPETTGFLTARGSTVANVDTKPPETTGFLTARGSTVANFDTKPPETTGFLTARGSTVVNVDTKPPEPPNLFRRCFGSPSPPQKVSKQSFEPVLDLNNGSTGRFSLQTVSTFLAPQPLSLDIVSSLNDVATALLSPQPSVPAEFASYGSITKWYNLLTTKYNLSFLTTEWLSLNLILVLWRQYYRHAILPCGLPVSFHKFEDEIIGIDSTTPWLDLHLIRNHLLYRYQRFFLKGQHSILWKVLEGDLPPSMPFVLQVLRTFANGQLLVTDGWGVITALLDEHLQKRQKFGRISIGTKLFVSHCSFSSIPEDFDPFKILHEGISLKLSFNTTKPVKWWTKLGFHKKLCHWSQRIVPIESIRIGGGLVPAMKLCVQRILPMLFVEFKTVESSDDESTVLLFRSIRSEDLYLRNYETGAQNVVEKFKQDAYSELNEFLSSQLVLSEQGDTKAATLINSEFDKLVTEKVSECAFFKSKGYTTVSLSCV